MNSKVKILLTGYFPDSAKNRIRSCFAGTGGGRNKPGWAEAVFAEPGQVAGEIGDADVLIPEHVTVDERLLTAAKNLRLVQTGAGYDNVDIEACTRHGVWVANASGVNATAVAEHAMGLILSHFKNIPFLDAWMKSGRDESGLEYSGGELEGKTAGIVGFGEVGHRLSGYCLAFSMRVLACDTDQSKAGDGVSFVGMDELLQRADIVSLHVPLTDQTRGMIGASELRAMKPSALLVNTSRGGVINEKDLCEALLSNRIRAACLDVFATEPLPADSPLRHMGNVTLTPHTAGMPDGRKFHEKRYEFFAQNILRAIGGEEPLRCLNRPDLSARSVPRVPPA